VQGVPLGLVFGTLPFVFKSAALSYTALGVFSMAGYPYSLKLLWSPIVDSVYWPGTAPPPAPRLARALTHTHPHTLCVRVGAWDGRVWPAQVVGCADTADDCAAAVCRGAAHRWVAGPGACVAVRGVSVAHTHTWLRAVHRTGCRWRH
jgi:hypothetical protein